MESTIPIRVQSLLHYYINQFTFILGFAQTKQEQVTLLAVTSRVPRKVPWISSI